jgi:cytidyltransferase-like protein
MKISVISGGFDPIHSGHIEYINSAAEDSDKLIVLLNSDEWLINKKSRNFMPFQERMSVLSSIKKVDEVMSFEDDEEGSAINGLKKIKELFPNDEIIFCNGGDRHSANIPETKLEGISFRFGVGGEKKLNSSSWILKNWTFTSEKRVWGEFFNLYEDKGIKVKELIVNPKSGMSFQRHFKRNEIWLVSKGTCVINFARENPEQKQELILNKFDRMHIDVGSWHQITNPYNEICKIIEIQYGEKTEEEDIERLSYYQENLK